MILTNIPSSTETETNNYIASNYFTDASTQDLQPLFEAYPSDLSAGSPFDTGSANNLTAQYKRLAAFQGDLVFQAPRRFFLQQRYSQQDTWSYCTSVSYELILALIILYISVETGKVYPLYRLGMSQTSVRVNPQILINLPLYDSSTVTTPPTAPAKFVTPSSTSPTTSIRTGPLLASATGLSTRPTRRRCSRSWMVMCPLHLRTIRTARKRLVL